MPSAPALVPAYLLAQAAAITAWWAVLLAWPPARAPFVVAGWPESTLLAFLVPDVLVLVAGSVACALGLRRERAWARPLAWLVAGAAFYATAWCIGALLATGSGWLSTAMMLACSAGMAWALRTSR